MSSPEPEQSSVQGADPAYAPLRRPAQRGEQVSVVRGQEGIIATIES